MSVSIAQVAELMKTIYKDYDVHVPDVPTFEYEYIDEYIEDKDTGIRTPIPRDPFGFNIKPVISTPVEQGPSILAQLLEELDV